MQPGFQTQFTLERLFYFPMRNFHPMPLRPYTFNAIHEAVDTIATRMNQSSTGKLTPDMLSGVTSGIIQPSAVPYASLVNNDFVGTRRFLFMMKVRHADYTGIEVKTYLFGYTEFDGITPNGHIDVNMTHYINNVVETAVQVYDTPLGVQKTEKLLRFYNTIYYNGGAGGASLYTQRPTDLYQTVQGMEINAVMGREYQISNTANMITPFSNNVVGSTIENNISTEYLSRLLTSGLHAQKSREVHVNSYSIADEDHSARFFQEASINETPFIRYLSKISGFRSTTPTFNMGNLMTIDNTIYDRFEMFNLTNDFSSPLLSATPEVGEYWHGQDICTVKAYSIIENTVALATKYGFTKLSFSATNMDGPTQELRIGITSFNSFLSLGEQDFNYLLEIFKDRFNVEIFMNETSCGVIPMAVECHVDLMGASKIYLQFSGYPGTWYTIPTFASSLFSPVITLSQDSLDAAAVEVSNVLSTVLDATPKYAF